MSEISPPLFIDALSLAVFTGAEDYVEILPGHARGKEIVLDWVEREYGSGTFQQAIVRGTGKSLSSVELSLAAWRGMPAPSPAPLQMVLLAQSYPDIAPLAAPLQQILEFASLRPEEPLGLTHLDGNGSIEGLRLIDWSLETGKQALLFATEARPFLHQRLRPGKPPFGNASICLSLMRESGALRVNRCLTTVAASAVDLHPAALLSALTSGFPEPDFLIAASALVPQLSAARALYHRTRFGDFDYQSADVWLSLACLFTSGQIRPGHRAALLTGDDRHQLSACLLEIVSVPRVSLLEW